MAIKLSGNEVITDTYELHRITDTDNVTANTINNAILVQQNILRIYDSNGTVVREFYAATSNPI